ncbi:MAG: hypothetical protein ICV75_00195 [Nitrospiraceae bacterium]|nr:hypothetical protein [Nitrospiraceae bacterium]
MRLLNILLGTLVVEVGFGLLWEASNFTVLAGWALVVAAWLWWQAETVTQVWAWSTLLLGLESFAWPLLLMVQLKASSVSPSEEEMGSILSAVVLGLFSAVFWISFSYGLFRRAGGAHPDEVKHSP